MNKESVIVIENNRIVIVNGKRKGKYNSQAVYGDFNASRFFLSALHKFVKRPSFSNAYKLINTPIVRFPFSYRASIYEAYFFMLNSY